MSILIVWLSSVGMADEGMWMPEQVPGMASRLEEMGLTLPASQLADPQAEPLSAIVSLGGCSASFVSPEGLIATNHHCVEGYLQYNASAEADYARDGYTAPTREDELSAGPTARVYIVERIDDVTQDIQDAIGRRIGDGMRGERLDRAKSEILAACEAEEAGRRCRVVSYYGGLEYRLIVQQAIEDVRLVYAPPRSVGSYGGEIDNWMWPRHTGDFALLRAYVAPDGSMAPYAEENVPYTPAHHLPLATDGVGPGDFVMVAGFPGYTQRHDRVSELRQAAEVAYPARLEMTEALLSVLRDHASRDPEAAARLASPIMGIANVDKNNRELLAMLEESDFLRVKEEQEAALDAWLAEDRSRRRSAQAIEQIEEIITAQVAIADRNRTVRWFFWAGDLLNVARTAYRAAIEQEKPDLERRLGYQDRDRDRIAARFQRIERSLYLPADRDSMAAIFALYDQQPAENRVPPLDAWVADQGGIDAALDRLYDAPALASTDARMALLEMSPTELEASDDPWIELGILLDRWLESQRDESDRLQGAMLRLRPVMMAAMLEMQGRSNVYPDANSTLRLTFGHVQGWSPADGIEYTAQTTVTGVVDKATEAPPFDAPPALLEHATHAAESRWADPALGDVPVNYLSTLDITGGNSGSATLNAEGEFVGLAFDGNTDSIASDWVVTENSRSIHVDVRYLLWVLEGTPAASWILSELGVDN